MKKPHRLLKRSRLFLVIVVITFILTPLSILAAISYTTPTSPYNIFNRSPGRLNKIDNKGITMGLVENVPPRIINFEVYNHGTGINNKPNVISFSGKVIDYNMADDIEYIEITIYDPYMKPMTVISWNKQTDILMRSNPGIILEGIDNLPEDLYFIDNGKILCWRVDNEGSISEGIIEFEGVYTFGKGCMPGHYYVDLYVADEREIVGRFVIDYVLYIEGEYTIKLYKGWNLISLPLYPSKRIYAEDILDMTPYSKKISYWDPVTQRFVTHLKSIPVRNFEIKYGCGYFIKVEKDTKLRFRGTVLDERNIHVNVGSYILNYHPIYPEYVNSVSIGWNCLGLPHHVGDINASTFVSMTPGAVIVAYWDPKTQMYKTYVNDVPISDLILHRGYGFFVLAYTSTKFQVSAVRGINPEVMII